MSYEDLHDLYVHQLRDLYNAEQQILDALPTMIERSDGEELRNTLQRLLDETRNQKDRLDGIFRELDASPTGEKCEGMEGLVREAQDSLERAGTPAVRDAAIIANAQRMEHYEMAGYGCARTYADRLGFEEASRLLEETLEEVMNADETLTRVAERTCNPRAEKVTAGV